MKGSSCLEGLRERREFMGNNMVEGQFNMNRLKKGWRHVKGRFLCESLLRLFFNMFHWYVKIRGACVTCKNDRVKQGLTRADQREAEARERGQVMKQLRAWAAGSNVHGRLKIGERGGDTWRRSTCDHASF
jgi:hypothetical protein